VSGNSAQIAKSGKTARKPNGYRLSGSLKLPRIAFDLLQKKAASDCGRGQEGFSPGKAIPSMVKRGGRCADRAVGKVENNRSSGAFNS
jgi:hypothetical protein